MTYQRVNSRYLQGTQGYDPVAAIYDNTTNPIDMTDKEFLDLVGLHKSEGEEFDDSILQYMDKGLTFQWDKQAKVIKIPQCKKIDQVNIFTLIFYLTVTSLF